MNNLESSTTRSRSDTSNVHTENKLFPTSTTTQTDGLARQAMPSNIPPGIELRSASKNPTSASNKVYQVKAKVQSLNKNKAEGAKPISDHDKSVENQQYLETAKYNKMLGFFEHIHDSINTLRIFKKMKKNGVQPSVGTYCILIRLHTYNKDECAFQQVLNEMKRNKVKPNNWIYYYLIEFYVNKNDKDGALGYIQEMHKYKIKPNIKMYISLINLYLKRDDIDGAKLVLKTMIDNGIKRNISIYNCFLSYCNNKNNFDFAEWVSQCMQADHIIPKTLAEDIESTEPKKIPSQCSSDQDVILTLSNSDQGQEIEPIAECHYPGLLNLFAENMDHKGIDEVIKEMKKNKMFLNVKVSHVLTNFYIHRKDINALEELINDTKKGIYGTDIVIFNKIIKFYLNQKDYTKVDQTLLDLNECHLQPDLYTYNTVLSMCAQNLDNKGLNKILEEMKGRGLQPDMYTYNTTLSMYSEKSDEEKIIKILQEIKANDLKQNNTTYSLLIKFYVKLGELEKAKQIITEIYENNIDLDCVTYATIINYFITLGDIPGAYGVLIEMKKKSVQANAFIYNYFLKYYVVQNDVKAAYRLLNDMQIENVMMDKITQKLMIDLHVFREEFDIAEELIEKYDIKPTVNLLGDSLDLHDLSHGSAYMMVRKWLEICKDHPKINIITGKGLHSDDEMFAMKNYITKQLAIHHPEYLFGDTLNSGMISLIQPEDRTLAEYNKMLGFFEYLHDTYHVLRICEEMEKNGVMPSNKTYALLISLFAYNQDYNSMQKVINKTRPEGILKSFTKKGDAGSVYRIIYEAKTDYINNSKICFYINAMHRQFGFQAKLYAKTLDYYVSMDDVEGVYSLIKYLEDYKIHFDIFIIEALVKLHIKRQEFALAEHLIKYYGLENLTKLLPKSTFVTEDCSFSTKENIKNWPKVTYLSLLQISIKNNYEMMVNKLLEEIKKFGVCLDVSMYDLLISFYANNDPTTAYKFFKDMQTAGFKPTINTYNALIKACVTGGDLDSALNYIQEMSDIENIKNLPKITYISILPICIKNNYEMTVNKLLEEYKKMGVCLDISSYNLLISFYADKDPTSAYKLFKDMQTAGIRPIINTYNALIKSCVTAGDLDSALNYIQEMTKCDIQPNLFSYNSLIILYIKRGEIEKAKDVYQTLLKNNIKRNLSTYEWFIQAGLDNNNFEIVEWAFQHMKTDNIYPITLSFVLMTRLCKNLNKDPVSEIFQLLNKYNFELNKVSKPLKGLIQGCISRREFSLAEALSKQFGLEYNTLSSLPPTMEENPINFDEVKEPETDDLEKSPSENLQNNNFPNSITDQKKDPNSIMDKEEDSLPMSLEPYHLQELLKIFVKRKYSEGIDKVLEEMKKLSIEPNKYCWDNKGIKPEITSDALLMADYNMMLRFYEYAHDAKSIKRINKEMKKIGYVPNVDSMEKQTKPLPNSQPVTPDLPSKKNVETYNSLVPFYADNDPASAQRLFNEMQTAGFQPDVNTYNCMIKICVNQGDLDGALSKIQQMHKCQIQPNVSSYNLLISLYINRGEVEKAKDVYQTLLKNNIKRNRCTYNWFIQAGQDKNNFEVVEWAFQHMKIENLYPNSLSFVMITKLCKNLNKDPAIEIFQLLNKYNFDMKKSKNPLKGLIKGCIIREDFSLAEALSKQFGIPYDPNASVPKSSENDDPFKINIEEPQSFNPDELRKLLTLFVQRGDLNGVDKVLEVMNAEKLALDSKDYNTLIPLYASLGNIKGADALINQMKRQKILPNVIIYNSMLKHYVDNKDINLVYQIIEKMKIEKIVPNQATILLLIDLHVFRKEFYTAEHLIKEYAIEPLIKENSLYLPYLSHGMAYMMVRKFLDNSENKNPIKMFLDPIQGTSYDTLLALKKFILKQIQILHPQYSIIESMAPESIVLNKQSSERCVTTNSGFAMNYDKYTSLIDSCLQQKQSEQAYCALRGMRQSHFIPPKYIYDDLLTLYSNKELALYLKKEHLERVFIILQHMKEDNIVIKNKFYRWLIKKYISIKELEKAREILTYMKNKGIDTSDCCHLFKQN